MLTDLSPELDQRLIERAWAVLDHGLDHGPVPTRWDRLSGGSGAALFALALAEGPAVLKVTTDPRSAPGAETEERVYGDHRLREWRPRLLAAGHDDELHALLLEGADPLPLAAELTTADWTRVAHRLGQLHRTAPGQTFRAEPGEPADSDLWADLSTWSSYGAGPQAYEAAQWLPQARQWADASSTVSCHGDCHLDNIVLRDDQPVWIDWTQAHRGSGFDDLAFCWQRAEFAGARPPRTAMGLAYASGRGIPADVELHRQLVTAELILLLRAWPPFLGYGDDAGRAVLGERLADLAHDPVWTTRRAA